MTSFYGDARLRELLAEDEGLVPLDPVPPGTLRPSEPPIDPVSQDPMPAVPRGGGLGVVRGNSYRGRALRAKYAAAPTPATRIGGALGVMSGRSLAAQRMRAQVSPDVAPPPAPSTPLPRPVDPVQQAAMPPEPELRGRQPRTTFAGDGTLTLYDPTPDQPGVARWMDRQGIVGSTPFQAGESMTSVVDRAMQAQRIQADRERLQQIPAPTPDQIAQQQGTMQAREPQPVREAIGGAVRGALQYAPIIGGQPALQEASESFSATAPEGVSGIEQWNAANANLARSLLQGVAQVPKGIATLSAIVGQKTGLDERQATDLFTYRVGRELEQWAAEQYPEDRRLRDDLITSVAPQVAGDLLSTLLTAATTRGVGGSSLAAAGTTGALRQA